MSLVIELNKLSQINKYKKENLIETFIIGIEHLSLDSKLKLTIEETKKAIELIHKNKKKVCINCNKVFHENEIEQAKNIINTIGIKNIDYLMFSDFGIYQTFKNDIEMIYYAPTYLTNTKDVNAYQKIFKNVVISNQITVDELKNIVNHNDNNYIDVFGKNAIFYSKREILTNYFLYKNQKYNPKAENYYLIEEYRTEKYPIIEDEFGFHLYEYGFYYLLEELFDLNINNNDNKFIIHTNFLNKKESEEVINVYVSYLKEQISLEKALELLHNLNLPIYKGAYDLKTVLLKSEVKTNA